MFSNNKVILRKMMVPWKVRKTMVKRILVLLTMLMMTIHFVSPSTVMAAQIKTVEFNEEYAENKEDAQKQNDELLAKWNSLSGKQKNDVYKSIKATLDAQAKFLDRLVKYELMEEKEAQAIKDDMYAKFDEMKNNDSLFMDGTKSEASKESSKTEIAPSPTQEPAK